MYLSKNKRKPLCAVLCLISCVLLAACSSEQDTIVGRWTLWKIEYGNHAAEVGIEQLYNGQNVWIFEEDGKAEKTEMGNKSPYQWEKSEMEKEYRLYSGKQVWEASVAEDCMTVQEDSFTKKIYLREKMPK